MHLIERLAVMFPTSFNFHAPLPLAIGIGEDIAKAVGIHLHVVEPALTRWTNRMNCLAAMAAPGSRRFNLDGTDAGEVSDEHRGQAAAMLAEKMAVMVGAPSVSASEQAEPST